MNERRTGTPDWEHFEHGADIGVRGFGATKADAFAAAARALTAVIVEPDNVAAREAIDLTCEADDDEALLVEWLNGLIYEMAVRRMLFADFRITIRREGSRLRLAAIARGEKVNVARHQPAVEVKGATYTELAVRQAGDGSWVAQCIVDV